MQERYRRGHGRCGRSPPHHKFTSRKVGEIALELFRYFTCVRLSADEIEGREF
jgi:hypothetical protein